MTNATTLLQEAYSMVQQMTVCINWLSQHCKTTNPTTALSQLIVADHYNGVTINAKGYDVVASDGRKIQVKGRWWPGKPSGPSGSWIAGTEHDVDLFVFVGFDNNYNLIYLMEFDPTELTTRSSVLDKRTPNKLTLSVTQRLIAEKNILKKS